MSNAPTLKLNARYYRALPIDNPGMDTASLNHRLTDTERAAFEKQGYFIVKDALPPDLVKKVEAAMDRLDAECRPKQGIGPHDPLAIHDFIGKDPVFLDLLDWPKTFLKVCDILGWNIQLYHSDYRYTPSCDPAERSRKKRLGWHIASPLRRYDIAATVLDMGCNLFVNKPPQHQGIQPHPRALQTQVQAVNKQ